MPLALLSGWMGSSKAQPAASQDIEERKTSEEKPPPITVSSREQSYSDISLDDPLPPTVTGVMDGERPPVTQVEKMKKKLEPLLNSEKYGHYFSKVRPWCGTGGFLVLSRPQGDTWARLEANLTHYQMNYALIFLALMVASIVINPKCLIVMCVLSLVWMAFLQKNDDPSWEVQVAGMEIGKMQRWMILSMTTAIALLCVVGEVLCSAALLCAALVLAHGVLHAVPDGFVSLKFDDEVTDII